VRTPLELGSHSHIARLTPPLASMLGDKEFHLFDAWLCCIVLLSCTSSSRHLLGNPLEGLCDNSFKSAATWNMFEGIKHGPALLGHLYVVAGVDATVVLEHQ